MRAGILSLSLFLFTTILCADESLTTLLDKFRVESELSNITKSESAGFVDIYTREDLERMQAHTLQDILKLFTIPNITRRQNALTLYTKPTNPSMPDSAIRLYINDHDMAAASYGSDAMVWSDISLDFIDHVLVYRSSSSVEFGNEPGTVIIKLYTKRPCREEGGKARFMFDQKGSLEGSFYYTHTIKSDLSYFVFFNKNNIEREEYENKTSSINSDENKENFYANLDYKKWSIEVAHLKKEINSFLGMGRDYTPSLDSEGLSAKHIYIHATKEFDNDVKLQLSYDYLDFKADYSDPSGIYAGALGYVSDYYARYRDDIFSVLAEKRFYTQNNKLLLGTFFKSKNSDLSGEFDSDRENFENRLDLYSIYAENSYSIDKNSMFVASLKGDIYRYDKEVDSKEKLISRVGFIKNIDDFQIKAFYIKTYYAVPMLYLYSENYIPYKANPDLKFPEPTLLTLGVRYKKDGHEAEFRFAKISVKNRIAYLNGTYVNTPTRDYEQYEFKYTYNFNYKNRVMFDVYYGTNKEIFDMSPKYGGHITLFNKYKKFDIYNELDYRSDYEVYGVYVDHSFNYTLALKYHINPDFSVGFKGENIFNSGFEQAYRGLDYSIPVFDQKFWLNVEYLF